MDRKIVSAKRDRKGNIVALCNPGQKWSPRRTKDVLGDINAGRKSYYVQGQSRRSYLRAVAGLLQTTADEADGNSLARLPGC
jgi:hypothetical protein